MRISWRPGRAARWPAAWRPAHAVHRDQRSGRVRLHAHRSAERREVEAEPARRRPRRHGEREVDRRIPGKLDLQAVFARSQVAQGHRGAADLLVVDRDEGARGLGLDHPALDDEGGGRGGLGGGRGRGIPGVRRRAHQQADLGGERDPGRDRHRPYERAAAPGGREVDGLRLDVVGGDRGRLRLGDRLRHQVRQARLEVFAGQRRDKLHAGPVPLRRLLGERAAEGFVEVSRQLGVHPARREGRLVDDLVDDRGDAVALVGPLAGERLVGDHREREEVGLVRDLASPGSARAPCTTASRRTAPTKSSPRSRAAPRRSPSAWAGRPAAP